MIRYDDIIWVFLVVEIGKSLNNPLNYFDYTSMIAFFHGGGSI